MKFFNVAVFSLLAALAVALPVNIDGESCLSPYKWTRLFCKEPSLNVLAERGDTSPVMTTAQGEVVPFNPAEVVTKE